MKSIFVHVKAFRPYVPCASGSKSAGRDVDHYFCFFFYSKVTHVTFKMIAVALLRTTQITLTGYELRVPHPLQEQDQLLTTHMDLVWVRFYFFYDLIDC